MSDTESGLIGLAGLGILAAIFLWGAHESGEDHAHKQFAECRALLATDSAAVLRYRTECAKWTLPPREAR